MGARTISCFAVAAAVIAVPTLAHAFVSPAFGAFGCGSMATIPGGTYMLGEKKNLATVAPFCMDRTEVTVDAYAACVTLRVCADVPGLTMYPSSNWGKAGRGHHPINSVSWWEANTYCISQGKRLPTEEEWEWAARGGSNGWTYPWGNELPTDQWCWTKNANGSTCEVARFAPNVFGVYDLAGNLWEWTASRRSPTGELSYVFRGGSWGSSIEVQARVDMRGGDKPDWRDPDVGFRCVKSL